MRLIYVYYLETYWDNALEPCGRMQGGECRFLVRLQEPEDENIF